jgi:hypothetical protein
LVNYNNIKNVEQFFINDKLLENHLSWENSVVKFFELYNLPVIKEKQAELTKNIVNYLSKNI